MIPLQYRHYNLPPDFPVITFLGERWISPREAIPYQHFHDCVEIGYCRSGKGTLHTGSRTFPYEKGDICILPAYVPHMMQSASEENSSWEYIFFDPEKLWPGPYAAGEPGRNLSEAFSVSQPILADKHAETIRRITEQIFEEFYAKPEFYKIYVRGCLMVLSAEAERMLLKTGENMAEEKTEEWTQVSQIRMLAPAIRHISERYGEPMEIPELAKLCHLSPTHFRRLFHQVMQASPLEYLNRVRVARAGARLLEGSGGVRTIAVECGFPTLSSFHRAFQKYLGMTPTEWKQVYRAHREENIIRSLDEIPNPLLFDAPAGAAADNRGGSWKREDNKDSGMEPV